MRKCAHKIGAVFYVLWGVVHVMAGVLVLNTLSTKGTTAALGMLGNGIPADQLPQGLTGIVNSALGLLFWDLVWFGALVTIVAIVMNWKNSRAGFWINLGVVLATDLAYVYLIVIPGYLAFPRGFMAPAFAVLGVTFSIIGRFQCHKPTKEHYWTWTVLAFLALITHTLLDWCTPYGTQLFWPLTSTRFSIDAISVIDPIYTIPLVVATLINFVPRWSAHFSQRAAILSLALTTSYLGLGYVQSQRALSKALPQLRFAEFQAVEVRATPTMFNIWLRRIVARDQEGNIRVGLISTWSPTTIHFEEINRTQDLLVEKTLDSEAGRIFYWAAMGMVSAQVDHRSDGSATVILSDQRYGLISRLRMSLFRARAEFDQTGDLLSVQRLPPMSGVEFDLSEEIHLIVASIFACGKTEAFARANALPTAKRKGIILLE